MKNASINTLGNTQRAYLRTLAGYSNPLSITMVASLNGMGDWTRQYVYRPMHTLHERGLVKRHPDPRRSDWSLWSLTSAGKRAADVL